MLGCLAFAMCLCKQCGKQRIATRIATAFNLWVFVTVRRDVQTSYERRRQDTHECPRISKITLGVKWSQVQILSARLRK